MAEAMQGAMPLPPQMGNMSRRDGRRRRDAKAGLPV
jgi:hypothetical protein